MTCPFRRHTRTWAALYQQRPAPEEGDTFKADWLRVVERLPPNLRTWGASDYAVSSGRGDYTVHVVVGLDPDDRLYLLDVWRRQSASNEWIDAFCDLVLKWKPIGWAEESGQIASGIGPFMEKRMRERRARVYRQPFAARLDKAVRRSRSAAAWRWTACTCRQAAPGVRSDAVLRTAMGSPTFAPSCSRFRPDAMTTRWMRSG